MTDKKIEDRREEENMKMKTIDDVMVCPKCNGNDTYTYSDDEIDFHNDGTGHYNVDCACKTCGHNFRLYTEFKYEIISSQT